MSKEAIPLQRDMFTGELVDNRSHSQKEYDANRHDWTQLNMFTIQEAPPGILRAKPVVDIDNLPSPPLVLIREDPRSEEEKDEALRREAQALTVKMFAFEPVLPDEDEEEEEIVESRGMEDTSDLKPDISLNKRQDTKLLAYLELIQIMQEQITTTWVDENYQQRFANQLPLSILNAIEVGLTSHEVAAAMQIGKSLGEQNKLIENKASDKPKRIVIPVEIEGTPKIVGHREGYRKSRRQQRAKMHVRR